MRGQKTNEFKIINNKLRYKIPNNLNKKLSKLIITNIVRRGKYLILEYEKSNFLLIHLGMTGFFRLSKFAENKKHDHLLFRYKNFQIIYNDIRKFGFIKLYNQKELNDSKHLKEMGPEPLTKDFNETYFSNFSKRNISIKSLLMDQNFVAGLGNIYCSEILFEASVNPTRQSNSLRIDEISKIIKYTKKILNEAIKLGGTTIKNFIVSDLKIGYFKNQLKVYGRENKICKKCQKQHFIEKIIQNGRSTFFCKRCQL